MGRVTATEVKAILDNTTLTDASIDAFIVGANLMVTNTLESLGVLDADTLKEIERWLTAHMISSTIERMSASEGAGGATIKYTGEWGKNLTSTSYGQMVLTLDTTGTMASLGGKAVDVYAVKSFDNSEENL
jgi:hypothetical protein